MLFAYASSMTPRMSSARRMSSSLPSRVLKVVPEYRRGVVLRLGKFVGVRGPGLIILIPLIETMTQRDLRVVTLDVPTQEVITKDNVTVKVNAVVFFRVLDPMKAFLEVEDYYLATSQISQTTMLNLWKERIMFSSFLSNTTSAHNACMNIRMIAISPEIP